MSIHTEVHVRVETQTPELSSTLKAHHYKNSRNVEEFTFPRTKFQSTFYVYPCPFYVRASFSSDDTLSMTSFFPREREVIT